MTELKTVLTEKAAAVDNKLKELMELKSDELAPILTEAMSYTLFSGGKRIRPVLSLLTVELLGGNYQAALTAGSALEMIHTYSLIHDDLPAMDDDKLRRGKKTNHLVYGEAIAVLAGDALLTYAFQILSELEIADERQVKLINLLARSAGYQGMVGGQVLDIQAENKQLKLEQLQKLQQGKTGALLKAAVLIGVYCSDYQQDQEKALFNYAQNIGILFQIVDDLLDLTGDTAALGKEAGRDEELNKSTYPSLLGLEGAESAAREYAAAAKASLASLSGQTNYLVDLVDYILTRKH